MRNVTITVDEDVARWARIWAAEHESSVSKLVGELLQQKMEEELGYDAAMKSYLGRKPWPFRKTGSYSKRDELYDRPVLRRR